MAEYATGCSKYITIRRGHNKLSEIGQAAIYSRKSKFTGKGESIGNQIELCRQYLASHFGEKVAESAYIYEDEGFSGGNLERPHFKKMMQDARKKKFSAIVCYRLDRISRNIGDFANLIEELDQLNISFVSIKEQFDTSSPMGRAMMYIASVFSQLERETIAERIRDNMLELSKTGRWLGGTTPTGFRSESCTSVTIQGKEKKAFRLKRIPEEVKVIEVIYHTFKETKSLTKTETFLIQNGYKTKNGHQFTRFAIKGILANIVYMVADQEAYEYLGEKGVDLFAEKGDFDGKRGLIAYNKTIQKQGRPHEVREMEDWIIAVGRHEGIISGALWIEVQEILEQNRSKNYRKPRSNVALLSGVLHCGNCGAYMRPKLSSRYDSEGERIYSYLCEMKEKSRMKCCAMKNVNGNILDRKIIEELKRLSEDNSEFLRQLKEGQKQLKENAHEYGDDIARLKSEVADTEKEIQGLVSSLGKAAGTAAEEYVVRQIEELHQKKSELDMRIEELHTASVEQELTDSEFDMLRQMLSSFSGMVDTMGIEQKRALIRTFIKRVVWDGENVHIFLFGSDGGINDSVSMPEYTVETAEPLGEYSK